jgi:hypothetical protein
MPGRGGGEDFRQLDLLLGFDALLAQLDDVDPACQHGIKEAREITLSTSRIGAEVQPGIGKPGPSVSAGHERSEGQRHRATLHGVVATLGH